jgi:hypothetical protein
MARSKGKIKGAILPVMKVKFLEDCDSDKKHFKKGSVYELAVPSANHWIKRNKAAKYIEPIKTVKPKKSPGRPKKVNRSVKQVKKEEPVDEPTEEPAASIEEKKTEEDDLFRKEFLPLD